MANFHSILSRITIKVVVKTFYAYRTVRNADPDADAGSVAVRYRTLLWYRCGGGRADPDLGPDPRLNPQTGYRIFFKAKNVKT